MGSATSRCSRTAFQQLKRVGILSVSVTGLLFISATTASAWQEAPAPDNSSAKATERLKRTWNKKRTTQAQRNEAAKRARITAEALKAKKTQSRTAYTPGFPYPPGTEPYCHADAATCAKIAAPGGIADSFGPFPNWANSPRLKKFVDRLPGLTAAGANSNGQYLPVAVADASKYPGSDYYEITLEEFVEKMHSGAYLGHDGVERVISNLGVPGVRPTVRGYRQSNDGKDANGNVLATDKTLHYLGPVIVATKNRPVRIKFINNLPGGAAGKLNIPVDLSVMGAGPGPAAGAGWGTSQDANPSAICASAAGAPTPNQCFTENRATLHLHGGHTPWISDGTPHQWIVPAAETNPHKKGMSVFDVPDMDPPGDGAQTFYWTNQQSSRMMFYHDHAMGITRLNVYVGEAAGYLIRDDIEKELVDNLIIPGKNAGEEIPLIIQDKSFVNTEVIAAPTSTATDAQGNLIWTGPQVPTIRATDPTWNWGTGTLNAQTGVREPKMGDLWWPHVYVVAQNPFDVSGVNPWGRWVYGPWFWPPTPLPASKGPKINPLFNPDCNPDLTPGGSCQPLLKDGIPDVSWGAEAFLDTAVVNGTVYPYLNVEPKAYRFRILNAAHDRFWNLQIYRADVPGGTEVKMVPAVVGNPTFPATWPTDGREEGVPDPLTIGPPFIQIGTEGGFLPRPVVVPSNPVVWNNDPTTFNAGNVSMGGLILGPAERADVIIDFSQFANSTLILYNDAPAAFPARDPRLDYYTGAPDMKDTGGFHLPIVPGYGPNTRTLMQIRVSNGTPAPFNMTNLMNAFVPPNLAQKGVFERGQEPIIVGQKQYNPTVVGNAYGTDAIYRTNGQPVLFPVLSETLQVPINPFNPVRIPGGWGYVGIQDFAISFKTPGDAALTPGQVANGINVRTMALEPKAIQDEMGEAYDEYGRMSAKIGLERPVTDARIQTFVLQNYVDPPTETIASSSMDTPLNPGGIGDGTQIWRVTHNGVDTHPVHFHLFDVQLINRVGWDGAIRQPDANELGWKDTIRISPLEDTIVAVRPTTPKLPFSIPNSVRPLNPAMPANAVEGFSPVSAATDGPFPPPYPNPLTNVLTNLAWEYVWHCHILAHEEMDMMRTVELTVNVAPPPAIATATASTAGWPPVVNWSDPTPVAWPTPLLGQPGNEIGFLIYRANADPVTGALVGSWPAVTYSMPGSTGTLTFPLAHAVLPANTTTFTDTNAAQGRYLYKVVAYNMTADGLNLKDTLQFSEKVTNPTQAPPAPPPAPTNFTAVFPNNVPPPNYAQVRLSWNAVPEATGYLLQRVDATFQNVLATITVTPATGTSAIDTPGALGTFYYRIYAQNAGLQSIAPATASVNVTAPPPPASLTANSNGTQITLTWPAVGGATGYFLERATNNTFTNNLVSLPLVVGNTTTTDSPAASGDYWYRVYTRINAIQSATATATTSAATVLVPIPAPTNVTVTLATNNNTVEARVRWTDNSSNEVNFSILRDGNVVGTVNPGQTEFMDVITLPAGYGAHTWTVRANASNPALSSTSTGVTITPPNVPPTAPTEVVGPTGTTQNATSILVRFMDNSTIEQSFRIERTTTPPTGWLLVGTLTNTSTTTGVRTIPDTRATTAGTTVTYRVRANHPLADPNIWPLTFTYTRLP
jgi:FtsP/CotA-like multicopper oxidase with cupredoxin domain